MNGNIKFFCSGIAVFLFAIFTFSCKGKATNNNTGDSDTVAVAKPIGPKFNPDSAFAYTEAQCNFGPRTMNSSAHDKCEQWIIAKFKQYGCEVQTQKADLKAYDGTVLKSTNIIARTNPKAQQRVLVCAHWDSRPWADNDPDSTNHKKPVMAANDGASGVAVMIELARQIQADSVPNVGIDFVCFDAEDWGVPQWETQYQNQSGDSWALGSNYFAKNLPLAIRPKFGILLDMVGGEGAQFYKEGMSLQYAPDVVDRVWRAAKNAGFESYFPETTGGMVTDDHEPLNKIAGIPTIDVIPYYPDCTQSSFGPTWHTVSDTMEHIDRTTLQAVGQTLIQLIYSI